MGLVPGQVGLELQVFTDLIQIALELLQNIRVIIRS